jgi:hypothetical protein
MCLYPLFRLDTPIIPNTLSDIRALTSLNLSDNKLGTVVSPGGWSSTPEGIVAIADVIPDLGALTCLDISSNNLVGEKGTGRYKTVDAEYSDESGSDDEELPLQEEIMEPDFSGIIDIANAIPNMRAISTFTLSGDGEDSEPVTMKTSMVEADFSAKGLGESGAIMVAAFLPKCT